MKIVVKSSLQTFFAARAPWLNTALFTTQQLRATRKFVQHEGGIAWWEMGEGKTRIALATFAVLHGWRFKRHPSICLIVCRPAAWHDWTQESLKVGLEYYTSEYLPDSNDYSRRRPTLWFVSHAKLADYQPHLQNNPHINFIIYDELYLYSNPRSQRTLAANRLSRAFSYRCCGLSGTLMPARDNTSIYGQTLVAGLSGRLAGSLTEYRSRYQYTFGVDYGRGNVKQQCNRKGSKIAILQRLGTFVDFHFPKRGERTITEKITRVPPTIEQCNLLRRLKDEWYDEATNLDIKTALELVAKTQQIANGWVKNNAGEIKSVKSGKLTALIGSTSECIAAGNRCLIWCAFRHDVEVIAAAAPFALLQMVGGKPFDLAAWESGDYPVVVATVGSGSSVNHFSQVQYAKYFSQSFRWLDLAQSRKRTDRKDSLHQSCHYEYFHVDTTLDKHVYDVARGSGADELDFIKSGVLKQWLTDSDHATKTRRILTS